VQAPAEIPSSDHRVRSVDPIMGNKRERRRAQYELLRTLLHRELRGRYRDSVLGSAWTLLQPLAMTAVYYVLFSYLFPNHGVENYALYILTGLVVWNFFANCLNLGTSAIIASKDIVRKVWFRRELLPMSVVLANAVTGGILLGAVVIIDAFASQSAWKTVVLAPVFFGLLVVTCFGIACVLSTVNVFFRDTSHLISVILLPLFFMTPVFYSLDQFPRQPPEWAITILRYGNPVTPYMESIRATALDGTLPPLATIIYCVALAPILSLFGIWLLRRYDDRLAVEL
jgi:ABC-2 type transport system permease protein